jgi:hypothetical protein
MAWNGLIKEQIIIWIINIEQSENKNRLKHFNPLSLRRRIYDLFIELSIKLGVKYSCKFVENTGKLTG